MKVRIWNCIYNTSFSQLMNRTNKLKCYITVIWKGLPGTNTRIYIGKLQVKKKNKFVNTAPGLSLQAKSKY